MITYWVGKAPEVDVVPQMQEMEEVECSAHDLVAHLDNEEDAEAEVENEENGEASNHTRATTPESAV